jgi:hypothetical protein
MISIIHYISAKRRLEEADKTFAMLDGDVSPMMRGQRDMIKFEMEYYQEKVENLAIRTLQLGAIMLSCYVTYELFHGIGML